MKLASITGHHLATHQTFNFQKAVLSTTTTIIKKIELAFNTIHRTFHFESYWKGCKEVTPSSLFCAPITMFLPGAGIGKVGCQGVSSMAACNEVQKSRAPLFSGGQSAFHACSVVYTLVQKEWLGQPSRWVTRSWLKIGDTHPRPPIKDSGVIILWPLDS